MMVFFTMIFEIKFDTKRGRAHRQKMNDECVLRQRDLCVCSMCVLDSSCLAFPLYRPSLSLSVGQLVRSIAELYRWFEPYQPPNCSTRIRLCASDEPVDSVSISLIPSHLIALNAIECSISIYSLDHSDDCSSRSLWISQWADTDRDPVRIIVGFERLLCTLWKLANLSKNTSNIYLFLSSYAHNFSLSSRSPKRSL